MRESERISVLKGVGEKTEQLFIKAGVHWGPAYVLSEDL